MRPATGFFQDLRRLRKQGTPRLRPLGLAIAQSRPHPKAPEPAPGYPKPHDRGQVRMHLARNVVHRTTKRPPRS